MKPFREFIKEAADNSQSALASSLADHANKQHGVPYSANHPDKPNPIWHHHQGAGRRWRQGNGDITHDPKNSVKLRDDDVEHHKLNRADLHKHMSTHLDSIGKRANVTDEYRQTKPAWKVGKHVVVKSGDRYDIHSHSKFSGTNKLHD